MAGDDKPSRPEETEVVGPPRLLAGKYRIGKLIGEGGMGSVYAAEHVGLGATVAVKLLNEGCVADPDSLARFRREARAMGAVKHDNVVAVMDTGTDEDGVPFIVMEYLEGETLSTILRRSRTISASSATRIAVQVLAGLSAAHAKNVIHRDLKPGNVFIARQPDGSTRAKVLDFGVSKLADAAQLSVTADGVAVGTPTYMAPEQIRGYADLDHRVDIYALGVMLYRMVTGKLPFVGNSSEALNRKILGGTPVPPRQLQPELSPELEATVLKAMSAERDDRFATVDEFRQALTAASKSFFGSGQMLANAMAIAGSGAVVEPGDDDHEDDDATQSPTVAASPAAKRETLENGVMTGVTSASEAAATAAVAASTSIEPGSAGSRRRWMWWVGGGAALAAIGGGGIALRAMFAPSGPSGPPLRLGVTRFLPTDTLAARFKPLLEHLEMKLDRAVTLIVAADADELIARLSAREVDLAALSPAPYIKARAQLPGLELVATPVTTMGRPGYSGSILVRTESTARSLADLRGKPFCFVKPGSTSGYMLPRHELRLAGLDPDTAFPAIHYGQNHLGTFKLLAKGSCEAASVISKIWHDADEHGLDSSAFRSLKDYFMPHDAYVAIESMPADDVARIRAALLELEPGSKLAREVLTTLDHGGFATVEDSDYDVIRAVSRAAK